MTWTSALEMAPSCLVCDVGVFKLLDGTDVFRQGLSRSSGFASRRRDCLAVVAAPRTSWYGKISMKGTALLLGFVAFTLLGNFFFKRGAAEIVSLSLGWDMASVVLKSANAWAGALFYGLAAIFWFLALSLVPMNLAITVSACVYVLVVLLAFIVFREPIPPMRWAGIGLIFLGLVFVGRTL